MEAYRGKIKKFMEQKNEKRSQLEHKMDNYWWD